MARRNVNVNINVAGNVVNSEITGVSFSDSEGWSKSFAGDGLFTKVFTEFLGLPSLQELETRLDVWFAKRRGAFDEYSRERETNATQPL